MPGPSRKTPQRIARMLEMHRGGASAREIGAELGVSHVAVSQWLGASGLSPNGGHGARKTRPRRELAGDAAVVASARQTVAEVEGGMMPLDRNGALAHLTRRLKQVSAITEKYSKLGDDGAVLMSDLDKAIKLEQALCTQIAELSPPAPPDPENDPNNIEAAAEVERKLMQIAETARRNAVCCNCGKNPFVRAS